MNLSAAVLSGGVRRSASICLFDENDSLMLNAKTGIGGEPILIERMRISLRRSRRTDRNIKRWLIE